MKSFFERSAIALTLTLSCLTGLNYANAQCGGMGKLHVTPSNWQPLVNPESASQYRATFLTVSEGQMPAIVGFWHVHFYSEGTPGVPDGAEVDAGYSQWHSDGTEIMNSGHQSPITSAFCLGVWKEVSHYKYRLNHIAIAWNATGTELVGPVNIREEVVLDADRSHFKGSFSITPYDSMGNKQQSVVGTITGSRLTPDSSVAEIF